MYIQHNYVLTSSLIYSVLERLKKGMLCKEFCVWKVMFRNSSGFTKIKFPVEVECFVNYHLFVSFS